MSQNYRMHDSCPGCLGCDMAATINKRYPKGFDDAGARAITSMCLTIASAVVTQTMGPNELFAGQMPEKMATQYVCEWSRPQ